MKISATLNEIKAALLHIPSVEDCHVMARTTAEMHLVAYVVLSAPLSSEQLAKKCKAQLAHSNLLPNAYVPLATLPLTETGEVDEQALSCVEVIDDDLIQQWEKLLQSQPQIEQVAVVAQEHSKCYPPLHLSDLLPDWKITPISQIQAKETISVKEPTSVKVKSESKILAVSEGGALEVGTPMTLVQSLQQAASQTSAKGIIYIQFDGSEYFQSYKDLLTDAEQIMAGLRNLGLNPQDKVIFQLELNQDIIPALWACILGGFIPVPISTPPIYEQNHSTVKKLHNAWQMLEYPVVLTNDKLASQLHSLAKDWNVSNFQVETIEKLRSSKPDKNWHASQPDELALLLLTSGSTGMPKGVMLTQHNLLNSIASTSQINQLTFEDISLNWLPLDHPGPLIRCSIRCVFLGCQQIHAPTETFLQNPLKWLDWIEYYKVTNTWAPNFAFALINKHAAAIKKGHWNLSSIKSFLNTAEAIVPQTARKFLELLAPHGLTSKAMQSSWGMAETASSVTFSNQFLSEPLEKTSYVELGPPIPSIVLRIVNDQNEVVEESTIGHLQIKGTTVTTGYYNNPQLNQETFTPSGWFKTGDLGFLHQGRLVLTGREKDVIIIRGANYPNHEIEAAIEEQVEGLEVSYTVACAIQTPDSDTDQLAVFFCSRFSDNDPRFIKQLKDIRETVTRIGITPDYLIPVEKTVIPKTSIGKIQRSQLTKRLKYGEFEQIIKPVDILLGNDNTLPDWFYRKIWRRKELTVLTDKKLFTNTCLVFLDTLGLGTLLSTELRKNHCRCINIEAGSTYTQLSQEHYCIDPKEPEHYQRLLKSLSKESVSIAQILHLWTYNEYAGEISTLEALEQAQERGIYSLLFLVQALAKIQNSEQAVQLTVISSHTQFTSSDDEIAYEKSPILGIVKSLPRELAWLDCRHIDISGGSIEKHVSLVMREIQLLDNDKEIAYRSGERLIPRLAKAEPSQEKKSALPFKQGGMYLISGGLGGIGFEIAKYLLIHYKAKLLLIGRTPLPKRSQWEDYLTKEGNVSERIKSFLELEALGGKVIYENVDICHLVQLQTIVAQVQSRWQLQLDGVIHLAGTYHERWLIDETIDSFSSAFRSKVIGAWVLGQLIKERAGSLLISFSSLASFFGGATIGAYSAANNFLDNFSYHQRYKNSLQCYCLASSTWANVGMSRGHEGSDATQAQGHYAMSVNQGLQSLLVNLCHDQVQFLIGLDGNNPHVRRYTETTAYQRQKLMAYFTASNSDLPLARWQSELTVLDPFNTRSFCDFQQIEKMPLTETREIDKNQLLISINQQEASVAPRDELENKLANIWEGVLGIRPTSIHDNFFYLGGHSLSAVTLLDKVEKKFGKSLSPMTIFQAPTIAKFAKLLRDKGCVASWRALHAVQPQGSRMPLFFIGSTNYARVLAPFLGSEQPVYGLNIFGLQPKDGTMPSLSVSVVARQYIQEICTVQTEGPYYLCGYCADAKVAFEMAQQLQTQGQKVASLIFIDVVWSNSSTQLQNRFYRFWHNLLQFGPSYLSYKMREKLNFFRTRILDLALNRLEKRRYQSAGKALPLRVQHKLLIGNFLKALNDYVPQPYSGRVTLLLSYEWRSNDSSALAKLADGGVEIYEVAGYHRNLFKEPQVSALGKQIKSCLEKVYGFNESENL